MPRYSWLLSLLFLTVVSVAPAQSSGTWLAPVCQPKLFGLQDASGGLVLKPQFDYLKEQEADAWIALSGKKYGVVNQKGEWLIHPDFISIYQYSKGKAVAGKKLPTPLTGQYSYSRSDSVILYGVVDESGVWLIDAKYSFLQLCDDGTVLFTDDAGKYGFLNLDGSTLIGASFEYCTRMSNGAAVIGKRKKNSEGGYYSYARQREFRAGDYYLIDRSGNEINAQPYDLIREFSEGKAAFNKGGLWKRSRYGESERMMGGKWGFLDASGKEVVQPVYDYVYDFENTVDGPKAKVRIGTRIFWIDQNGNEVKESASADADVPEVFCNPGSFGYIDRQGNWVIQPQFLVANDFSEGLASVITLRASDLDCDKPEGSEAETELLGTYYRMNDRNNTLNFFDVRLHHHYDENEEEAIRQDSIARAEAGKRRLYGYIDASGTTILPARYEQALTFHDGRAYVKFRGKWGVINRKGEWVMPPVLETPEGFSYVDQNSASESYGYSVRKFDVSLALGVTRLASATMCFSEGMGPLFKYGKYGFMDTTGKIVVAPVYDEVKSFSSGLAAVRHGKLWGFIDKTGKEVIPVRFQSVSSFSAEGMALAGIFPNEQDLGPPKNGMQYADDGEIYYGYLDVHGKWLIKPQFISASEFSEGLAVASKTYDTYGYIDKTGNFVIAPKYNFAGDFHNGFAYVRLHMYDGVYIDKSGKQSKIYTTDNPPPFNSVELSADEDMNGRYGFVDPKGKVVIPYQFTNVGTFQLVK